MELQLPYANNRMEKRTLMRVEKEKSHELLHSIVNCQEQDNFIHALKAHTLSEKYRILEQRLHQTHKSNIFKPRQIINTKILKDTQHLVKHQNKVEANIQLHKGDKLNNNFTSPPHNHRSILPYCSPPRTESFFTPKTREQILGRHAQHQLKNKTLHTKSKKQSNFSIQLATEGTPIKKSSERLKWGHQSQISAHPKDKQNAMKTPFQSKSNSFSTFTHYPSRIYGKQKQELVSLDQKICQKTPHISGFTRHQLFSYYKSLISFSRNSEDKYLAGFETMLNLMNITTNETTIRQLLSTFITKPSFQEFIDVFQRIVESSLKESVVDYFQIVLDGKWNRELCFDEIIQLLSERMSNYRAKEIVEEVYYELEKENDQKVTVQEIVALCYKSEQFCAFMRGYCQQTPRRRPSQKPKPRIII